MAEYIDRTHIQYDENCCNCNGDEVRLCKNCNEKYTVSKYDIDTLPTADVVERSKIDKIYEKLITLTSNRGFLSCETKYIQEEIRDVFKSVLSEFEIEAIE